jgi:glycosyltransferase involved in cell wall biosynthesis
MLGWVDYQQLPTLFRKAGAFVLPSTYEPWGLVLNEAMACGLPVLVSRHCGGYPELCRDGTNGLGFTPTSIASIVGALTDFSSLPRDRRLAMGAASRRMISSYSWTEWTSGVTAAIHVESARQGQTSLPGMDSP